MARACIWCHTPTPSDHIDYSDECPMCEKDRKQRERDEEEG
jgi:predicted nucleic acid-binding Zn ribbon protein